MDIEIRKANAAREGSALAELDARIFFGLRDESWSVEEWRTKSPCYWLFVGKEKIGILSLARGFDCGPRGEYVAAPDALYIYSLGMLTEFRGSGLGTLLLQYVTAYAHLNGFSRIVLDVRASNTPAIRCYEKFGFVQRKRVPHYYENPSDDLLTYELRLPKKERIVS